MTAITWYHNKTRQIQRRIVVEGDLVLRTPAHFGNGDGDEVTDLPLLLDPYDNQSPLLTGASLAGALRSYLREQEHGFGGRANSQSASILLFGGGKGDDDGEQSPLIVADSLGQKASSTIRAGVRLEGKTRTAADKALFDVQLWQAGTTFPLRLELLIGAKDDADKLKQALATALDGLSNGRITLGARKRRGYGEVKVSQWRVKEYDLTDPAQLSDWLANGNRALGEEAAVADLKTALNASSLLTDNRHFFTLIATFTLQGSLLIRSGEGQDDIGADRVHLHARQANGRKAPIVSGTSLAGALRARAYRIANTLDKSDKAKALIYKLFGPDMNDKEWAKGKERKERVQASRLLVKETVVENGRIDLVQNRVSIDRFTGGARDTALFNEQPVFAKEETSITVDVQLRNPQEAEIGLLLLLLKDLWTGDLPLGGESSVGRGRLKGKQATLVYQGRVRQEWTITADGKTDHLSVTGSDLQTYVDQLDAMLKDRAGKQGGSGDASLSD